MKAKIDKYELKHGERIECKTKKEVRKICDFFSKRGYISWNNDKSILYTFECNMKHRKDIKLFYFSIKTVKDEDLVFINDSREGIVKCPEDITKDRFEIIKVKDFLCKWRWRDRYNKIDGFLKKWMPMIISLVALGISFFALSK